MVKQPLSNKKVGVLGYGEIGKAVAKFYPSTGSGRVKIKDIERDDGLQNIEILHVCIPWSDRFVDIVKREIKQAKPTLTIIHSTVAPGTVKKIGGMVVHSPVRGIHPYLHKGIKTFVKYIGADSKKAGVLAQKHLSSLKIKTKVFYPSKTTELAKLLDTTYYGLVIAWHGEMEKVCKKLGVKFEDAITDFNITYNEGYKKLGKNNVIRPVLYPPRGKIGGHCVIPNAKILKKFVKSKAIDLILKYL